jgi:hypothetical protein
MLPPARWEGLGFRHRTGGETVEATGIIGLLNPVNWIEKAYHHLRRPKLQIYYDPDETYHVRSLVDMHGALDFFCHLMVKNQGKVTAKACQARLISVDVGDPNGDYGPHPGFMSPVVLKWAHEPDFDPRDIDPDLSRRLDLCYTVQPYPEALRFFSHKVPSGNRTDFPPGNYMVAVRVSAENAASVDGTFIVSHNGTWDRVRVSDV